MNINSAAGKEIMMPVSEAIRVNLLNRKLLHFDETEAGRVVGNCVLKLSVASVLKEVECVVIIDLIYTNS